MGQSIEITRTTYKLENMCNAILAWSLAFFYDHSMDIDIIWQ